MRLIEVKCNSNFFQTEPNQLHELLNKDIAIHPSKLHSRTLEELHCFVLSIAKVISIVQQIIELLKELKNKKKIERS